MIIHGSDVLYRRPVPAIDILLARTFRGKRSRIRSRESAIPVVGARYDIISARLARVTLNLAGTIACHPIVLSINRINRHARHVYQPCILRGCAASGRFKPRKPSGTQTRHTLSRPYRPFPWCTIVSRRITKCG